MDLDKVPLFSVMKKQIDWLTQRQEVLAQNLANSDTPMYRPSDLRKFDFNSLVRRQNMQVNMNATASNHLLGQQKQIRNFDAVVERHPYETAPNGNSVVLEEQASKVSETQLAHKLTTELYRKHLNMYKLAIGKGQ